MAEILSPIKRNLVLAFLILLSLVAALVMAEIYLRYRADRIEKSNHLEMGMVRYDRLLGWKLSPGWQGRHKHFDFEVTYKINSYGFRGDFNTIRKGCRNLHAVVGDSFTFGMGVQDGQTFVDLLNNDSGRNCYLNFSVPGYSTDQESLLIRGKVMPYSPQALFLVVYLGNDLFDNTRGFPLQSKHAKPFFSVEPNGLALQNNPVPHQSKPDGQARKDLQFFTFKHVTRQSGIAAWAARHFQLARALGAEQLQPRLPYTGLSIPHLFKKELNLFKAIVSEIRTLSHTRKFKLILVLLPGRSYIERQGSVSHRVQAYLAKEIASYSASQDIPLINIAATMKQKYNQSPGDWYFKNEGHLTSVGHTVVAGLIQQWLEGNDRL